MPTYPIEESDYAAGSGALSGERVFKNTVPATTVREQTENGIWHGLRTLVRQFQISGDLTAANYAAELTAGFANLSKAVRRAARRFLADNIGTVTCTTSNTLLTPAADIACYHLIDAVSPIGAGAYVHFSGTYADTKNRLVLIVNMTDSFKVVGNSYYQKYIRLEPRESCWFYGLDESGSGTVIWQAIGRQFEDPIYQTFSAEVTGPGGTSGAGTVKYRKAGNRITLILPTMTFSCSGGGNVYLQAAGSGPVPDILTQGMPSASSGVPYAIGAMPSYISTIGYAPAPFFTYDYAGGPSRRFLLYAPGGGYFPAATIGVAKGQVSYDLPAEP